MLLKYRHFDDKAVVACSGGPDSMALLDLLSKKKKVQSVLIVDHSTNVEFHEECVDTIHEFLKSRGLRIRLIKKKIWNSKPKTSSLEEFWRHERRRFYTEVLDEELNCNTLVTGHNLNDLVETWIMSSFNGGSQLMPRKTILGDNILFKPLLHTPRENILEWCQKYEVPYVLDKTNLLEDSTFDRVKVRTKLLPAALDIYPGLNQMVRRRSLLTGD